MVVSVVGVVVVEPAAGVLVEEVVAGVEVVDPPAAEEVVLPAADEPLRQEEPPSWTVKGAEEAVAPVLSRRLRPREVPEVMLTVHVSEVPDCWPKLIRAAAEGCPPGRMETKYGPASENAWDDASFRQ